MVKTDKKLPVGVDSFEKLVRDGYYYLDKTGFIRQLVNCHGEVNLFTCPRRFGKTLNMSMLKAFFEIGTNKSLFDGLEISRERENCAVFQGQYPVLFLSLKEMGGKTFEDAIAVLAQLISIECQRLSFLLESTKINCFDKEYLEQLVKKKLDIVDLKIQDNLLVHYSDWRVGWTTIRRISRLEDSTKPCT